MSPDLSVDRTGIAAFCRRWHIAELSLFGSALREDFRPDSDVDVLIEFAPDGHIGFDNRVPMMDELREIFGREVDLVIKETLRNPFRRRAILKEREILYAA